MARARPRASVVGGADATPELAGRGADRRFHAMIKSTLGVADAHQTEVNDARQASPLSGC